MVIIGHDITVEATRAEWETVAAQAPEGYGTQEDEASVAYWIGVRIRRDWPADEAVRMSWSNQEIGALLRMAARAALGIGIPTTEGYPVAWIDGRAA